MSLSALIADPSSSVRMSLRTILQGLEINKVDTASTISEARRKLLEHRFDIVLCEFDFGGNEETGQDLLEELRAKKALPMSTIFIVVTAESSYPKVVGVAEETPDEYMLKPVQAGALSERIERAFLRRETLIDIYEALHAKDYHQALRVAQQMMSSKTPYLNDVVRLAAQILYRLERYDEAATLYRKILSGGRNLAWAKFGLARVALKQGDGETAEQAMRDILAEHTRYLPVYNQLGDLFLSQERFADLLDVTEQAIRISPHSLKRLQQAGQLAYSLGDLDKASDYLGRAVRINGKAIGLDFRAVFKLVLMQLSKGVTPDGLSLVKQMQTKRKQERGEQAGMLGEWYCELAQAVESIARREPLSAIDRMRKLAANWDSPEVDLEFTLDYLSVVERLYADDIVPTLAEWMRPLVLRFAASRQIEELLAYRVLSREKLAQVVEEGSLYITQTANEAAQAVVDGDLVSAADQLIQAGRETRNNRLLSLAANTAAKCFRATGNDSYRLGAEESLSLMHPPADAVLQKRVRELLSPSSSSVPDRMADE
ncbi:response regulator [Chitinimonas lacunae]|uniref:Response regulator n=1 Tax=Chitinimonas lacunae TaxID=1963018 RepID=A0ABV8MSK2_9NEIS